MPPTTLTRTGIAMAINTSVRGEICRMLSSGKRRRSRVNKAPPNRRSVLAIAAWIAARSFRLETAKRLRAIALEERLGPAGAALPPGGPVRGRDGRGPVGAGRLAARAAGTTGCGGLGGAGWTGGGPGLGWSG